MKKGVLTITFERKKINIPTKNIFYVMMEGNNAFIHEESGKVYRTRATFSKLGPILGDDFITIIRGCMVSVFAIHDITDKVNLINGETLDYATRRKLELIDEFHAKQKKHIRSFSESVALNTQAEYLSHYSVFDELPIAFCDIEMIFDEEGEAVDWIFRYANKALCELEKVPMDKLLGNTFGNIFPNMDVKWLRTYEKTALFGETIKIIDYSQEINTYLDIICFPTFKGHCGCILFDVSKINSHRQVTGAEKAMAVFFAKLTNAE